MPLYEFVCECGKKIEKQLKFAEYDKDKANQKCKCGKNMRPAVNAPPFSLKGSGWFSQDYGITDMEINKNLDEEKKIESVAKEMQSKDRQAAKQF